MYYFEDKSAWNKFKEIKKEIKINKLQNIIEVIYE